MKWRIIIRWLIIYFGGQKADDKPSMWRQRAVRKQKKDKYFTHQQLSVPRSAGTALSHQHIFCEDVQWLRSNLQPNLKGKELWKLVLKYLSLKLKLVLTKIEILTPTHASIFPACINPGSFPHRDPEIYRCTLWGLNFCPPKEDESPSWECGEDICPPKMSNTSTHMHRHTNWVLKEI